LVTPMQDDVAGSYGEECMAWLEAELEIELRPWQAEVCTRALEYREDGSLRWPSVVLTVPRQCGKSVLARAMMLWRLICGEQYFGEPQTVISTAQDLKVARHIWKVAADTLLRRAGDQIRVMRGAGQERIEFGNFGNEWLLVAPTATAANGLSVSMAMIDEAFAVNAEVVTSSIRPTMLARRSPQLFMLSTAGHTSSRLLQDYREQAINQMDDDPKILLLEWSAPSGSDIRDPQVWKDASPMWDGDRASFIAEESRTARSEAIFSQEYLNIWSRNLNAWVASSAWEACESEEQLPPRTDNPGTIAVEVGKDGDTYGALHAVLGSDGYLYVRGHVTGTLAAMRDWLGTFCKDRQGVTVIHHKTVALGKIPHAHMQEKKAEDDYQGYYPLKVAIEEGRLRHPGNEQLTEQVLSAGTWQAGHDGYVKLSAHASPIEIPLARGLVWAAGRELDPARTRKALIAAA
ncbi:MAG: terminase large subunit domain-containing protein, partial [Miltoncostaeaceae bacterium]